MSWSGPDFALGPTLHMYPNIYEFEQCVPTKGLLRQFPQRAHAEQAVAPG